MITSAANWRKPLAWNRSAEAEARRHRVFCASMADVFEFHPQLDPARSRLWDLAWRKAQGLSQEELARLLGVDKMTISRWERAERAIPSFLHLALEALQSAH